MQNIAAVFLILGKSLILVKEDVVREAIFYGNVHRCLSDISLFPEIVNTAFFRTL